MTDHLINILTAPHGIDVFTYWTTYDHEIDEPSMDFEAPTAQYIKDILDREQYFDGEDWTYTEPVVLCQVQYVCNHQTGRETNRITAWDNWEPHFENECSDYDAHNNLFKASRGL